MTDRPDFAATYSNVDAYTTPRQRVCETCGFWPTSHGARMFHASVHAPHVDGFSSPVASSGTTSGTEG